MTQVYTLKKSVILDKRDNQYRHVITINKEPQGPLKSRVKRIRRETLSPFQDAFSRNCCGPSSCDTCVYVFPDPENPSCYLDVEKFSDLLEFMIGNGYTIDDTATRLLSQTTNSVSMRDLICFVKY
jgi:hypothetical protein